MEWKTNPFAMLIMIPLVVLLLLWKGVKSMWLRPKKIEKLLRQQGFKGNSYKPFVGDVLELLGMAKELVIEPISFSDDPLPRYMPFIHHTIQKHGKNSFAWLGPTPWLILSEAEKIKEILTRYEDFQKPDYQFTRIVVVGLFAQEGKTWAKHRKIINPAFHMEKLKNMFDAVYEGCNLLISSWEEIVSKEGSAELDVCPSLNDLSGDIISRAAFGTNFEEGRRIFSLQTEYVNLALTSLEVSNYVPGWRCLPTKKNKRAKEVREEVEELLTRMINLRRKEMEAGGSTKNDLLGIMLESNMRESEDEMEIGLTTEEIVQECRLFYLAGSETTSGLLAWTLILLSKHQIWQEHARKEVLQMFGKDGKPDFDSLSRLKIVNMILNEVLRLYPPGYMLMRKVYKDVQLRELLIPAGTEIILPLCLIQRDSDLWGEDAKEFNPEKFAKGVSNATNGQAIYFPFSAGPRVCIGQNFALLEAKLVLTLILQRFSFELSPTYAHTPSGIFTLKPQHGANLILRSLA